MTAVMRQPWRDHAYEWWPAHRAYRRACVAFPLYEDANEFTPRGRPCARCQAVLDRRAAFAQERADNFRVHGHEFQVAPRTEAEPRE